MNRKKILLIDYDDISFIKQLQQLNYHIIDIQDIKQLEAKLTEVSPNLIICPLKSKYLSGFDVYNRIKETVVHQKIPYLLISNKFTNNDIYIAEEMGIDGYLFPPFDKDIINNIISGKIKKSREGISMGENRFRTICEIIPYAVFIVVDKIIIEANKAFNELVYGNWSDYKQLSINNVFHFDNGSDEIKYMRMMNGLSGKEIFRNISLISQPLNVYNLYLSNINTVNGPNHLLGVAVPFITDKTTVQNSLINKEITINGKNNHEKLFTQREEQILKLSAIGTPVKLIADELGISARTVEKHRSNIISKTNSGNIIEAVNYAKNNFMIEIFD